MSSSQLRRQPLFYVAAVCVVMAGYFRFRGLGVAPFAVDEYYLARSIEGVLRSGAPSFMCGGLYMRGLLLQYSSAALELAGASSEYAPRFICTLCSLLCLPATFILGKRAKDPVVGLVAVILCALSVWEIEIARFGRMYAPFQAVFLWYTVFFLRYTVDGNKRAIWPMIALSVAGPLVWEGGGFLAVLNLVSLFLRRWPEKMRRGDWVYLISSIALLGLSYAFLALSDDFRFQGSPVDSWPPGYSLAQSATPADHVAALKLPLVALKQHRGWLAAAVLPLLAALLAVRRIWQFRDRRFLSLALLLTVGAALLHQLLLVFGVFSLLLLTRLLSWEEFSTRRLIPLYVLIGVASAFWMLFALATVDWQSLPVGSFLGRAALLGDQFLRFPDVIAVVVRPWARAVPHLGAALLVLVAASFVSAVRNRTTDCERVLLIVLLVLLLAAGAITPPREETRYVFFLYPVALIIAVAAIRRLMSLSAAGSTASVLTATAALAGFALTEDFQPQHLLHIDSPQETFRLRMTPAMEEHLIIRTDYRAVAHWLQQHKTDDTTVINGVHGLDHYYNGIDYFYVEENNPNFPTWSCRKGTVERWGNYPLLYTTEALAAKLSEKPKAYLVAFSYDQDQTLASLAALHPRVAMATGDVIIIELRT
jgi:drug/metabolite transporter superfamily protein YnfA